ncbi:N-acetyltransferase [Arthrobacter echini]|uniref:N-acetyltransferase n=1 Tax=Arthrobacter echini TaxID=1529066 RepID=A0A4S5EAA3_9MICC|nr:N-acetyltransferase [Arthrobacter echini]THJ68532.1 N-acetyltransferase [Arthrobacter echini]
MTEPVIVLDTATADVQADQELTPAHLENTSPATVPPTRREREAQWLACAVRAEDLTAMSLADLRIMATRMFRLLDTDDPPIKAHERYLAAVEEIEARVRREPEVDDGRDRTVFKDSAFTSRFELYLDGYLTTYLRYLIVGGQLTLRSLVEKPGFEDKGFDRLLVRHALLNAHRRRLSVVAACPEAQTFLEQNPQYRTLARIPG